MKLSLPISVVVAILFTAVGFYSGSDKAKTTTPPSPAMSDLLRQSLPDIKGQMQPLSQWAGKVLIINFWATWCTPCVKEIPELSAFQSEIANKNIQIIGIGIDSTENITKFSSKYQINYPLYIAGMEGAPLLQQFGNRAGGLPFTVLIGRDGKIKKTYLGQLQLPELRKDLTPLR